MRVLNRSVPLLHAFIAVLAVALMLGPDPLSAQQWALERADSLLAAGDYEAARSAVDDWWSTRAGQDPDAAGAAEARALFLRARLTTDPAVAEADYVAIAHRHPSAAVAPSALLRLGQWLLAAGEPERASGYLERLVSDYPGAEPRDAGVVWLERAGGGPSGDARTVEAAPVEAAPEDSRTSRTEALIGEPLEEPDRDAVGEAVDGAAPEGDFAIELGAFRNRGTALALADRLERFGFEARLVTLAGSDRVRVRVGRYADRASADDGVSRLQQAGFQGGAVADATRERSVDR